MGIVAERIKTVNALAVIGMCKNAGKTTVLNELLSAAGLYTLGLTSIGRDGESTDIVTQTPKPEIYVKSGTVFVTAAKLLTCCDVTREILSSTDIMTPLGNCIIVRALSDGFVQLAGPSTAELMGQAVRSMFDFGAEKVIIDGAISRRSFSMPTLCDAAILCTGASYDSNLQTVVDDTCHMTHVITLPATETRVVPKIRAEKYALLLENEPVAVCNDLMSLCDEMRLRKFDSVYCGGALTKAALQAVMPRLTHNVQIITRDSSRVLLARGEMHRAEQKGVDFRVLKETRLLCVALNPYSAYGTSFGGEFYSALSAALSKVNILVVDVKREGL